MNDKKGALYLTAASVFYMATGYLLSVWLGRFLGPEVYGKYGVIITLMTLFNLIQTAGLPQAVSILVSESPHKGASILKSGLYIQIILAIILMLLLAGVSPLAATYWNDSELSVYVAASALILPFYGLYSIFIGYYNGKHLFKKQAFLNSAYSLAKLVFVLILTFFFGLAGAVAGFVLAPLIAIAIGRPRVKLNESHAYPKKVLSTLAIPLITFSFLATLQLSIDLLIIKGLLDDGKQVGYYVAAQNIALVPYLALNAFSQMILPKIARALSKSKHDEAADHLRTAYRNLIILLAPVAVLMVVFSKQIISVLYSQEYTPGAQALEVLVVAYSLLTVYILTANALNGAGRTRYSNAITISSVALSTVLVVYLTPLYGIQGSSVAILLGSVVATICGIAATSRLLPRSFPYALVAKIVLVAGILYIPLAFLPLNNLLLCIAAGVLYLAFYFFLLVLVGEIKISDRIPLRYWGRKSE